MRVIDKYDFFVAGFLRATLDTVRAAVGEIIGKYFAPSQFEMLQLPFDSSVVYDRRPPSGAAHLKRAVFFEPGTAPSSTVFIANMEDGWATLFGALAEQVPGQHMFVRSLLNDDYPLTDFEVWQDGVSIRYVGALREDPSWEFTTRGRPLDFEFVSNYEVRAISQRLTRSTLLKYLEINGWDLTTSAFWKPKHDRVG